MEKKRQVDELSGEWEDYWVSVNNTEFDVLKTKFNITFYSLTLQSLVKAPEEEIPASVKVLLERIANELSQWEKNSVIPVRDDLNRIQNSLLQIKEKYFPNQTALSDYVVNIENSLDNIEADFKTSFKRGKSVVNRAVSELKMSSERFINEVFYNFTNEFAGCKPVNDAVYGSVGAFCLGALPPFNAYWFMLFISIFLIFLTLWISCALTKHYVMHDLDSMSGSYADVRYS